MQLRQSSGGSAATKPLRGPVTRSSLQILARVLLDLTGVVLWVCQWLQKVKGDDEVDMGLRQRCRLRSSSSEKQQWSLMVLLRLDLA